MNVRFGGGKGKFRVQRGQERFGCVTPFPDDGRCSLHGSPQVTSRTVLAYHCTSCPAACYILLALSPYLACLHSPQYRHTTRMDGYRGQPLGRGGTWE